MEVRLCKKTSQPVNSCPSQSLVAFRSLRPTGSNSFFVVLVVLVLLRVVLCDTPTKHQNSRVYGGLRLVSLKFG